jgi:DNA-binding NarL/FixJ family response regulator
MEFPKARDGAPQRETASPQKRIRLVLLDGHVLYRESLARMLVSENNFDLVAECATSSEAMKSVKSSDVDVVLVDIGIAMDFMACARRVHFTGKSLVIAREIDAISSATAFKFGAAGVFVGSNSFTRLVQAIQLVAEGEAWVDPKVIQLLAERYPQHQNRWDGSLTEREQAVLGGVVDGLSSRQIGDQLGLSESTIKGTLQQLFYKAGVRTRSQLVRIALEGPAVGASKHSPNSVA